MAGDKHHLEVIADLHKNDSVWPTPSGLENGGPTTMDQDLSAAVHALGEFRRVVGAGLASVTSGSPGRNDRAAAQEALQLVWSFVVSDFTITDEEELFLRMAFPDELFGDDPQARYDELRDDVQDDYADKWKHLPSDQLCTLACQCALVRQLGPLQSYRKSALNLAARTAMITNPTSGVTVADIARFDSMLRRVLILTEVAIADDTVPETDQVLEFATKAPPEHSMSFDFVGIVEPEVGVHLVRAFADHYNPETAVELLSYVVADERTTTDKSLISAAIEAIA